MGSKLIKTNVQFCQYLSGKFQSQPIVRNALALWNWKITFLKNPGPQTRCDFQNSWTQTRYDFQNSSTSLAVIVNHGYLWIMSYINSNICSLENQTSPRPGSTSLYDWVLSPFLKTYWMFVTFIKRRKVKNMSVQRGIIKDKFLTRRTINYFTGSRIIINSIELGSVFKWVAMENWHINLYMCNTHGK